MDHDLIKLVNQFAGRDMRLVGFSVNHREDDRLPAMKEHAAKVGYNFTYVYDESQEFGRKLGATARRSISSLIAHTSSSILDFCTTLPQR